jgi:hypothetical protein
LMPPFGDMNGGLARITSVCHHANRARFIIRNEPTGAA